MEHLVSPGPACPGHLIGCDTRRLPRWHHDVIVIGAGVAGACAALSAAEAGADVLLLVKDSLDESNTAYAQGGIASVLGDSLRDPGDSLQQHVCDTLEAGAGLCDPDAVRDILAGAPAAIDLLMTHGCRFDCKQDGHPALTREGGHRHRRVLHGHGDGTGRAIIAALSAALRAHPGITILEQAFVIDLLGDDDGIHGALLQHDGQTMVATAAATVLATGGCGRVWRETTNPRGATGDGLALAYRAGARVTDLEFMQFHPTTLYVAGRARLLITEAMRGEGAHLVNNAGERFLLAIHPDGELAPRDIVSTAIIREIQRQDFPHVWLDASHLDPGFLASRFPTIDQACRSIGIDFSQDWIPVHPSAHYHCGGVQVDSHGQTSLPRLLACGEVAASGLHGANRLASNSLLEGVVLGQRAGLTAAGLRPVTQLCHFRRPDPPPIPESLDVSDLTAALRALMWQAVGIERDGIHLARACRSLDFWLRHQARDRFDHRGGWELHNALLVGRLVAHAAHHRPHSCGTHLRRDSDGPAQDWHLGWFRDQNG